MRQRVYDEKSSRVWCYFKLMLVQVSGQSSTAKTKKLVRVSQLPLCAVDPWTAAVPLLFSTPAVQSKLSDDQRSLRMRRSRKRVGPGFRLSVPTRSFPANEFPPIFSGHLHRQRLAEIRRCGICQTASRIILIKNFILSIGIEIIFEIVSSNVNGIQKWQHGQCLAQMHQSVQFNI